MASPNAAKTAALQQRLAAHAARWPQITEIKVRWRAGYAAIDAVLDDEDDVLQLCRVKDTGHPELWGFALFTYSNERHEDNILPTGLPFGTPEDALDCAAGLYLGDPPARPRTPEGSTRCCTRAWVNAGSRWSPGAGVPCSTSLSAPAR